jgi:hypothetical protein
MGFPSLFRIRRGRRTFFVKYTIRPAEWMEQVALRPYSFSPAGSFGRHHEQFVQRGNADWGCARDGGNADIAAAKAIRADIAADIARMG